jgi:predicted nucleic acid-binding protein
LDTNAIIYYTDDEPAAVATLEPIFSQTDPVYISTLTELELFSYAHLTVEEEARLETFLRTVQILPLTSGIARIAADLRRLYPRLRSVDSGIAATAVLSRSTLISRNVGDCVPLVGVGGGPR